jgi:Protein of unknown function (DUF2800)
MNLAEPAHSPFGGSVAARILRCPASVNLTKRVPAPLRRVSAYAERGTALHRCMALLIERERTLEALVGETIEGYRITADDAENALRPALACAEALLDEPGAEYYLEQRVVFPTIPGAFGTVDLIVRIGTVLHVVDFKFGVGVRVLALYPDGDEDVINAQLAFYATAARHSLPKFFAGVDEIKLTILQPVSIEPDAEMVSFVAVAPEELDTFVPAYRTACKEALSPTPRLERGDWCRFCSARPICPAHSCALLDFSQFAVPTPPSSVAAASPATKQAYLQVLADGLNLIDAVKDLRTALHDQAKRALENGDHVPGYALSAGRAERHWHDENAAIGALIRLGLARADLLDETMRSPRQVETRAKARGLTVPAELIASRRSGVSLVRSENAHVPVPGRNEIVRSFSAAIEAFQEGGTHDQS